MRPRLRSNRLPLLLLSLILLVWQCRAADIVTIPDLNLEAALRDNLQKWTGELTVEDLAGLEILAADLRQIGDLTGLEHASSLREAYLSGNPLTNYSVLLQLNTLQVLSIGGSGISNLVQLAPLSQLRQLWIWTSGIQDVAPLAAFPELEGCVLDGNPVTNLGDFPVLTNLATLRCNNIPVTNWDFLENLPGLTFLDVNNCGIHDVSGLTNFPTIHYLGLSLNPITNAETLGGVTHLRSLFLFRIGQWLTNLSFCSSLRELEALEVSEHRISDITPLLSLSNLYFLKIEANRITNLAGIGALWRLQYLNVSGNSFRSNDLAPRRGLADLSPASGLTNLTALLASQNPITNLTLTNLPVLELLSVKDAEVADIASLESLGGLFRVDVRNNHLDLTRGTPNRHALEALIARGGAVQYSAQKFAPRLQPPSISMTATGAVIELEFDGAPSNYFAIEQSTNLVNWATAQFISSGAGIVTRVSAPASLEPTRYFRVRLVYPF